MLRHSASQRDNPWLMLRHSASRRHSDWRVLRHSASQRDNRWRVLRHSASQCEHDAVDHFCAPLIEIEKAGAHARTSRTHEQQKEIPTGGVTAREWLNQSFSGAAHDYRAFGF
jgi:hypothetical protein